ncbi:NAD(P)H-dependent flavin oxidoreductase [Pseudoclavibacter terrae]|uniref:Propionate 3-nitronate monooxygenase n=1 Tax=Pseudoclavibacter terrae TaxID=1530195 RepID=A0A7J5AYK9_9MICO|nr:nitronate monooxygenase [Pseudoclavibacter terrae]KAB1636162.1 nitronate monooxygenase [Pseudoclavibacter terrae]
MSLPPPLDTFKRIAVAPMAGGPSTPALVIAAANAGHFAQLAGGYKTAAALEAQIAEVTEAGVQVFGVNLFVPNPHPIDEAGYAAYWERIRQDASTHDETATMAPRLEDDDEWAEKLDAVILGRVPAVSFTFGLPSPDVFRRLKTAGVHTIQTVTSVNEARRAAAAGADALTVQGHDAGGHSGVWDADTLPENVPLATLVERVRTVTDLPLIASGGITRRDQAREVLDAGADLVAVGTVVLRSDESGASATHKAALADERYSETTLTRAFTGRPARALVNAFVASHTDAPVGYPALHHLTRAMRAKATAAGDSTLVNLWAGEGWREAKDGPIVTILDALEP